MQSDNKNKVLAAVAGAAVGAGAVVATVFALKDKKNQDKIQDLLSSAKEFVKRNQSEASDQLEEGKEKIKKVASQVINKAEQVTKSAKKDVKNI